MSQDNATAEASIQETQQTKEPVQVDAHTVRAREAERTLLRADIEAFLQRGGKVTSVAANLRADAPRKPQNNYGKGPL